MDESPNRCLPYACSTFTELHVDTRLVRNLPVAGSFASPSSHCNSDVLGGYAQPSSPKLRSNGQLKIAVNYRPARLIPLKGQIL